MNDTVVDAEVMDPWGTSCPKLPVWEDANDQDLVERANSNGRSVIRTTALGRDLLEQRRRTH